MVMAILLAGLVLIKPTMSFNRLPETCLEQNAKLPSRSVWKCAATFLWSDKFLTTLKETLPNVVFALIDLLID